MKKILFLLFFVFTFNLYSSKAQGILSRIKDKAAAVADKAIDKKADELLNGKKKGNSNNNESSYPNSGSNSSSNNQSNPGGDTYIKKTNSVGRLNQVSPDVIASLDESLLAYNNIHFGEARFNLKQALIGIELEIGKDILSNFPPQMGKLNATNKQDEVKSSGFSWDGLSIAKLYENDNQQLKIQIISNPTLVTQYNTFLNMGAYGASNQSIKILKFKNDKAVLEFNNSQGYNLYVPINQSVLIHINGINFESDSELLQTINALDVESLKQKLN